MADKAAAKLKELDTEAPNSDAEKAEAERKRAIIAAAMARAKAKLETPPQS